jgi:DNA-binding transcriptional MerR regulator
MENGRNPVLDRMVAMEMAGMVEFWGGIVTTQPMIKLADMKEALDALCPGCQKLVRDCLLERLSARRAMIPNTLEKIRHEVASAYGVEEEMLAQQGNSLFRVRVRRAFARKARRAGFSLSEIGSAINRHHTSVANLLGGKGH